MADKNNAETPVVVNDEVTADDKILDLSDAGDETFRYIKHGIENWRETNAKMHFIPDTQYQADLDHKYIVGMVDGLVSAGGGLVITSLGFILWPVLQKAASKLSHLIYKN